MRVRMRGSVRSMTTATLAVLGALVVFAVFAAG